MENIRIAVVGCGSISGIYLKNLTRVFSGVEICGVCDSVYVRAEEAAREYGIPRVYAELSDLLGDESVQIVLNLTPPAQHYPVSRAALEAGKHVYSEKPLASTLKEGASLIELARDNNLLIGCAPDTFLGAGLQTCRKLLDDGYIGTPVGATAFVAGHGPESWHPNPEFFYKKGGGPMMDTGPYCLTALVHLLGPVNRVVGAARASFPTRTVTNDQKFGQIIRVEVPTHVVGIMEFQYGAICTVLQSFDIWPGEMPCLEIYGSEGTLSIPDPNLFGGPVRLRRGSGDLKEIPLTHGYEADHRGIGVADMARALRAGIPNHRASGELAYHVLELIDGFLSSSKGGAYVTLRSSCLRPEPLPTGLLRGSVELT